MPSRQIGVKHVKGVRFFDLLYPQFLLMAWNPTHQEGTKTSGTLTEPGDSRDSDDLES